ncbi:hypothetical protein B0H17DRAFT_1095066 [Mycena rosella]|uniref:NAD(P)-binding protein n=1 Tax=Mycena rosella TaxID=1033263 RepID=A0AAD7G2W6_MYCRO|nr:hypothetical protein B0H17DRAFT_1095066 [Mycena rosella]
MKINIPVAGNFPFLTSPIANHGPNAAKALQSVSLAGQNKTAVIVGGTSGIGAAVARSLAKLGCSKIIISGRNEARGTAVLEVLRGLAPKGTKIDAQYVKVDVSDTQGMRAAAEALQKAAGDAGMDYLVMSQNGVPTGTMNKNADGYESGFALQAISRFALMYLLTTRGALAPNAAVMSVCNQGQSLDDLSVDDLSLEGQFTAGLSKTTFFMNQSKRDSSVIDAFYEEFNIRYPQYRYFHLYPGLVNTEDFDYNLFPGFLKYGAWLGMKLIGTTPDQYANLPVYVLTAPPESTKDRYFTSTLAPGTLGKWAADKGNREALWPKLLDIIGE